MTSPIGCHQIGYSLTPPSQRSCGDRVSCLPHPSEYAAITWRHPLLLETWVSIYLDFDVSMRAQLSRTVSHCYCILRQLCSIRRSLPEPVFQSLIPALVLTKLDFGNATLAGIQSFQLNRLQAIMNAAARLVFQSSRYDHITPLLHRLHWLRAPARIVYKQAVSSVFVDSRRPTWLTTYSQSLNFRADSAYIHRRPRHWLYHRPVSEPLAIKLFPSQRQKRGTVSCRKWRHH